MGSSSIARITTRIVIMMWVSFFLSTTITAQEEETRWKHDLEFFFFETKSFPGIVNIFRNHSAISSFGYTLNLKQHGLRTKFSWYDKKDEDFDFYSYYNRQVKIQAGYQYRFPLKDLQCYPFLDVLYDWSSSEHLKLRESGGGQVMNAVSNQGAGAEIGVGLEYQVGNYVVLGIESTAEYILYQNTTEQTQYSGGDPVTTTASRETHFLRYSPVKAFSIGFRF